MKAFVVLMALTFSAIVFSNALTKIPLNLKLQEVTHLKKFTFEIENQESRTKLENLFSDKSKFIYFSVKSNTVIVITEDDFSFQDFNNLLIEMGNRTKTLSEQYLTKEEFYNSY